MIQPRRRKEEAEPPRVVRFFQDEDIQPALGQKGRGGEARYAGTDDDDPHVVKNSFRHSDAYFKGFISM
jgi:hypothetical protein